MDIAPPVPAELDDAWDLLERFGQALYQAEQAREQIRLALKAVHAGLDARAVGWPPGNDPQTGEPGWRDHSERVARLAVRLAAQMGLPAAARSDLYLAGLLHDVGMLGIRDGILLKPGRLTSEEFAHVQQHPLIGARLVASLPLLAHLRSGVRHHHERWDGRGYPDGLAGEQIPLPARILALAESCDAMMAVRPYRPALSPERIDAILLDGAGGQWDPDLVAIFMTCRNDLYAICRGERSDPAIAAVESVLRPRSRWLRPPRVLAE